MSTNAQSNPNEEAKRLRQSCGLWLREQRERLGLTQRNVSEHVGFDTYIAVSTIENGRARVIPNNYRKWAEILELEPAVFAKQMLFFYEPMTYELLFDERPKAVRNVEKLLRGPGRPKVANDNL